MTLNFLFRDPNFNSECFGSALEVGKVTATQYTSQVAQGLWRTVEDGGAMKPPCPNCEQLIGWYGITDRLSHFKLWET